LNTNRKVLLKSLFDPRESFDVNKFARNHFNGGGHKNASGGKSNLNLKDTITKFTQLLEEYKLELNS